MRLRVYVFPSATVWQAFQKHVGLKPSAGSLSLFSFNNDFFYEKWHSKQSRAGKLNLT